MDIHKKFEVFEGRNKTSPETMPREFSELVERYGCDIQEKPEWCVLEKLPRESAETVYMWIKPSEEAEFMAQKIAKMMRALGSNARAVRVEDAKEAKTLDGELVENLLK